MTKEEIEKGRITIANFMNVDELVKSGFDITGQGYLTYDSNWIAFMPAFYKFRDLEFERTSKEYYKHLSICFNIISAISTTQEKTPLLAFKELSQGIEWYNNINLKN